MPSRYAFHKLSSDFPASKEPAWENKVERWYQLDSAAYGLCELYTHFGLAQFKAPDMVFLGSPGGCNLTDRQFAADGATSPAKFVHTLPGVRGSVLLQIMEWHGPLLCFQNDPHTLATALIQTSVFSDKKTWIFGQTQAGESFCLRACEDGPIWLEEDPSQLAKIEDRDLLSWLAHPTSFISIGEGWRAVLA